MSTVFLPPYRELFDRLERTRNRIRKLSQHLATEANPELRDIADDLNEILEDRDPQ